MGGETTDNNGNIYADDGAIDQMGCLCTLNERTWAAVSNTGPECNRSMIFTHLMKRVVLFNVLSDGLVFPLQANGFEVL